MSGKVNYINQSHRNQPISHRRASSKYGLASASILRGRLRDVIFRRMTRRRYHRSRPRSDYRLSDAAHGWSSEGRCLCGKQLVEMPSRQTPSTAGPWPTTIVLVVCPGSAPPEGIEEEIQDGRRSQRMDSQHMYPMYVIEALHTEQNCGLDIRNVRRCLCGEPAEFERRTVSYTDAIPPDEAIICTRNGLFLRVRRRWPERDPQNGKP